jgi:SAM-dependent methyltransferase
MATDDRAYWEREERRLIFGKDAEGYDNGRPSYPPGLIDHIVEQVGAEARVVEIGTGTAKATRQLAEQGMTGVGVEPDASMAAVARRHLDPYAGWRVDVSDFEHWEPSDGDTPVDLVSAAQSFHWVNPGIGLPKARDLLRPGGWLMAFWNLADEDRRDVRLEIDAVYDEHAPGEPFCPQIKREPTLTEGWAEPYGFTVEEEHLFRWTCTYTTEELLALLGTHSNHRLMTPEVRSRVFEGIAAVVNRHGGTFDYPYVCRLRALQRT